MKPVAKTAVVIGGYIAAFGIAAASVSLYDALSDRPASEASGGMAAFGDSMLFLGVFGLASVVPTGAGLFFLRPYRPFWYLLSAAAVLIAATGLAAVAVYMLQQGAAGPSPQVWPALAVLRLLVAPLLGLAFLTSTLLAPARPFRLLLFAATLAEAASFMSLLGLWMRSLSAH